MDALTVDRIYLAEPDNTTSISALQEKITLFLLDFKCVLKGENFFQTFENFFLSCCCCCSFKLLPVDAVNFFGCSLAHIKSSQFDLKSRARDKADLNVANSTFKLVHS